MRFLIRNAAVEIRRIFPTMASSHFKIQAIISQGPARKDGTKSGFNQPKTRINTDFFLYPVPSVKIRG